MNTRLLAPTDRKARDSIKILEDTTGDGRVDKITTFADGLNIPIDGKVRSGLFRRKVNDRLFFVDGQGNEFSVSEKEIDEQFQTPLSLMPENWLDTLKDQEILDLAEFLMHQTTKPASSTKPR